MISTAVALGVVAATAAGYATSTPHSSNATFSLSADAAADETTAQDIVQQDYLAKTQAAALQLEAVEAKKARAAQAALAKKARAAQAALAAARTAAAQRAAREQARVSILAKAQSNPRAVGKMLAADLYGWSGSQFSCLDSLWTKESGWKYKADNPSSSAYGIPQALPGSKMASAGSDWATNPATQIKWGLTYIKSRYGSPCAAWGHSRSVNWY